MSTKTLIRFALVAVLALTLLMVGCGASEDREGSNRVVLLLDDSGTYRSRQTEAIDEAMAYLEKMSHAELRRWEYSSDKIAVISIDAMPDVLWEGNADDLKKQNRDTWVKRFNSRQDYGACTDVAGAFRLAAKYLDGDARTTSKYVVVFSDLIEELPGGSASDCPTKRYKPAENFPWEALRGAGITVLWIPAAQRLIWQRAASENNVAMRVYTESEAGTAELQPPPKKIVEPTEAEQKRAQAEVVGFFSRTLKILLMIPLGLATLVGMLLVGVWARRRFGIGRPLAVMVSKAARPTNPR